MLAFWLALYFAYAVAPIAQTPPPSISGMAFNFFFVILYAASCWSGSTHFSIADTATERRSQAEVRHISSRLIFVLALIGCVGAAMSIVDKASGDFFAMLIDAAALRNERAQQLLEGAPNPGGIASAIGFLLYPAGYAAVYTAMLSFERLPVRTSALAVLFVPLVFAQSMAAGGRSGILVLLILIATAAHVRRFRGQPAIPKSPVLRWSSGLLLVAFLLYSSAIWFVRAELSGLTIDSFLEHAEFSWGVTPSRWLQVFAEETGNPELVQTVMSTAFYFTQALSVTERVLSMPEVPTLWGGYHIDIVAAALRAESGTREFLSDGYALLLDSNVYGFFTGAWSALYIDFGLVGAVVFTVTWGLLAGRSFRAMKLNPTDARAVMYGFWIYAIFISFVSPPLGFSNSSMTFCWFVVCSVLGYKQVFSKRKVAVR